MVSVSGLCVCGGCVCVCKWWVNEETFKLFRMSLSEMPGVGMAVEINSDTIYIVCVTGKRTNTAKTIIKKTTSLAP